MFAFYQHIVIECQSFYNYSFIYPMCHLYSFVDYLTWQKMSKETTTSLSDHQNNASINPPLPPAIQSLPELLFQPNETEIFSIHKLSQEQRDKLNNHQIILYQYCWKILSYFGEETKLESNQRKITPLNNNKTNVNKDNKSIKRDYGIPLYWRVSATAIVYFQRFYLCNNLSDFHPQKIMIACVLLAGKTEDIHISLSVIKHIDSSITKDSIYNMELQVLEALHFNIRIYHPRNILPTIIGDCRKWVEQQINISKSTVGGNNSDISIISNSVDVVVVGMESKQEVVPVSKKIKTENKMENKMVDSSIHESKAKSDIQLSSSLVSSKVIIYEEGSSEMRKQWLLAAECVIEKLQCTHILFLYTPTEIVISTLKLCLEMSSDLLFFTATFEAYLLFRYGHDMMEKVNDMYSRVKELYHFAVSTDIHNN